MSRPYVLPDPNDRSKNEPSVIVSSRHVIGIYNQNCGEAEEKMQYITQKVQDWFLAYAKSKGWDDAYFAGNQCIMTNKFGA